MVSPQKIARFAIGKKFVLHRVRSSLKVIVQGQGDSHARSFLTILKEKNL